MNKLPVFFAGMGMALFALSCTAADYQGTNEIHPAAPAPHNASKSYGTMPHETGTTNTVAPDNTEINRRDNETDTLTPQNQSNTDENVAIVSTIRKKIMASDMSTLAKNVKIIVANGVVTLRGPVNTAAEKATVERLAATATGVRKIDNQLDIKGVSTSRTSNN
jgi:hypothetical protein